MLLSLLTFDEYSMKSLPAHSPLRVTGKFHEIHRGMLMVDNSTNEDWDDWFSEEYWDRWLLWSYPNINNAKMWMAMRKDIRFMPVAEELWYV